MAMRPAFQHQGPTTNCVIDDKLLGWKSCTAYAMAMLIDAATNGTRRPKGCRIRRLVKPKDIAKGLTLRQVAEVAEETFGVPIAVRTGANLITVEGAVQRIRAGRGFVLQGNNMAWGLGDVNHAVYIHEVRGGTAAEPEKALLYDPQRPHERWMKWRRVLAFGAALRMDNGSVLGPGVLYAGFAPKPMTPHQRASRGAVAAGDGVELMFGARKLPHPDRTVVHPPGERLVNVRSSPLSLSESTLIEKFAKGTVFIAFQQTRGVRPPGAASAMWFGDRDGTHWIHVSGLRRIGGDT